MEVQDYVSNSERNACKGKRRKICSRPLQYQQPGVDKGDPSDSGRIKISGDPWGCLLYTSKEADDDPDINGMHFPVFRDLSAEIADADHKGADEQEPEGLLQPVKGDVPGHDHCNGEDQDRKVEQAEEGKDPRVRPGKFQRDIPV